MSITEELKPCPKCKSSAFVMQLSAIPEHEVWTVVCSSVECDESTDYYRTKQDAIAAWNRRAK